MHIERLLLRDIGPFDDVTIEFPKGTDPQLADVYLLTGPNGTGKSTILYALATLLAARSGRATGEVSRIDLSPDLLSGRMRSAAALAAIRTDRGYTFAVTRDPLNELVDPFWGAADASGRDHLVRGLMTATAQQWQSSYAPLSYAEETIYYANGTPAVRRDFGWAAFAYAGLRSVSDVEISAIQDLKRSPFENSLSFFKTSDTEQLANWIASQNFRRLKAKEAGNDERANQLARSIRDIELVIADVIDDPDFGFVLTEEDDNVRIRWNGVVLRLGLLPDGLKSIVSWVADLLMRLDRIPWEGNLPVLQRRFLLLLDEVDIHLHPAWQRKVLPLVQRAFPNAQIIASTHSPFVVGSADDARIITLGLRGTSSVVTGDSEPQIGVSYSAIARSIFGIESEFDIDTEQKLARFHAARRRLLSGDQAAELELNDIAAQLAQRSEELRELIALELAQLRRQRAMRATP